MRRLPGLPVPGKLTPVNQRGTLGVIGNISRDHVSYPTRRGAWLLGGAALYVALAATRSGLTAAPASVIGDDLGWVISDPRLAGLDMSGVKVVSGSSCAFGLTYDYDGTVTGTDASFGVSQSLTGHALSLLGSRQVWHVCCRRPLDAQVVLGHLASAGMPFSADFHLASAADLMPAARTALTKATAVFVNAAEFAVLSRVVDARYLPLVVISDGPRPAVSVRRGRVTATAVPPVTTVAEVTGAGDTLAGTFLAAVAAGMDDQDALEAGVSAAAEAVASTGLAIPGHGG
jgi:sugar/nucleoside kinase (ribokinase family)